MEESILMKIKEYIEKCPLLKNGKINVDYLSEKVKNYSIETVPIEPIIDEDVLGNEIRQYTFVFASQEVYSQNILDNILNSKFYEDFSNWIYMNNKKRVYPDLTKIQGIKEVTEIKCTTPGYAFKTSESSARYQIQLRVEYKFNLFE